MIEVWSWPTPNGHKVHIALEELELPYKVIPINIGKGDQFKPEFLAITPNHRIPAIVDPDGPGGKPLTLFESAAIMIYLSEKTGGKLIPKDPVGRYKCLEWMMFQMGGVGPMFGQYNHFANYAVEKIPYAIDRYTNEVARLHRVLDKRLAEVAWLAGDEYSMADIITFPWIRNPERRNIDLANYPNVKRWHDAMAARPAVQRGVGGAGGPPAQGVDDRRRTRGDVRQDPVRGALIAGGVSARLVPRAGWMSVHVRRAIPSPHRLPRSGSGICWGRLQRRSGRRPVRAAQPGACVPAEVAA